jgi:hypothetical protein
VWFGYLKYFWFFGIYVILLLLYEIFITMEVIMGRIFFILCFMFFVSVGYGVSLKVLPFVEVKGGKYVYKDEGLSIGVSYSVGGLLGFLTGYNVDYRYTNVNYTLGDLDEAISNNQGYDMYMWVEYKKGEGIAEYLVRVYSGDKREILSFSTKCNYEDVDDIFRMIDEIVLRVGSNLKSMNIKGFGTVRIVFEGLNGKVYRVMVDNNEVLELTNSMTKEIKLFSDVIYSLAIEMKGDKGYKVMYRTNITIGVGKLVNLFYKAMAKLVIHDLSWKDREATYEYKLGDDVISLPFRVDVLGNTNYSFVVYRGGKKVYDENFYIGDGDAKGIYPYDRLNFRVLGFSVGSGSKGMLNVGGEVYLSEVFRLGLGLGVSFANVGSDVIVGNVIGEGRYNVFRFSRDIGLDGFLGVGTSFVFVPEFSFLGVISSYVGVGLEVWKFYLDVGGSVGYRISKNSFVFGPHVVLGMRF